MRPALPNRLDDVSGFFSNCSVMTFASMEVRGMNVTGRQACFNVAEIVISEASHSTTNGKFPLIEVRPAPASSLSAH